MSLEEEAREKAAEIHR